MKTIDLQSASKWKFPATSKRARSRGSYTRAIIPDTHGSKVDGPAISAMLADLKVVQPREIILLGDHLDCGGFLAQHHTMGYVAETVYTWEDDVNACNQFLDKLQETCPKSEIHYLLGNHEMRIEKWIVTQTLRNGADAEYLMKMLAPWSVLRLDDRKIHYYKTSKAYQQLRVRGTIRIGKCHFTHGTRTGVHATSTTLRDFGSNVVHGHTHTAAFVSAVSVKEGIIGGWCPGCLCELVPMWGNHSSPTRWSHGYGLQLVRPTEEFLHINVPILEGRSYLVELEAAARKR